MPTREAEGNCYRREYTFFRQAVGPVANRMSRDVRRIGLRAGSGPYEGARTVSSRNDRAILRVAAEDRRRVGERSGIPAGPRRCPIGPPTPVSSTMGAARCPQFSSPNTSAVVVIDMANDFVYAGGVIADAGGPDYQARAQAILAPLARLLAAARDAGNHCVIYATDAHTPARHRKISEVAPARDGRILERGNRPKLWHPSRRGISVVPKRTYSPFLNPGFERAFD